MMMQDNGRDGDNVAEDRRKRMVRQDSKNKTREKDGVKMADEKICPLIQKGCLKTGCMMWVKVTVSGTDKEGKTVTTSPPEQCAFIWSGLAGLKDMQFPGKRP
jgi:hypothetical protein